MTSTPSRIIGSGALALGFAAALTANRAAATSDPVDPTPTSDVMVDSSEAPAMTVEMTPECADVVALLDAQAELGQAFLADDGVALGAVLESLPGLAAAARASAPAEIVDQVTAWLAPVEDFEELLAGVELTDIDVVVEALNAVPTDESSEAAEIEVETWATENCNWSNSDPFADAPEPPECDVLDAAAAAAAASIDIAVTDSDGAGDFSLPGFAIKSCSYGNGTLTLSTISFNDAAQVPEFYVDLAVDNGGTVLDVDLGELPDSTIVVEVDGLISVAVLEAPIPFSVGLGSDDAPATVVAAAEAVLRAQPADGAEPATTDTGAPAAEVSAPATTEG